jgi:hypothetical protein
MGLLNRLFDTSRRQVTPEQLGAYVASGLIRSATEGEVSLHGMIQQMDSPPKMTFGYVLELFAFAAYTAELALLERLPMPTVERAMGTARALIIDFLRRAYPGSSTVDWDGPSGLLVERAARYGSQFKSGLERVTFDAATNIGVEQHNTLEAAMYLATYYTAAQGMWSNLLKDFDIQD